jgi:predicted small lipoprotein YifL
MRAIAVLCLLTLAACGADGAPESPSAATTGVTLTGDVQAGVVVK